MPSLTSYAVLAVATVSTLVSAKSLAARVPPSSNIVPISVCNTTATGILETTNGHNLNIIGDYLRFATGANPLTVAFQSCQPNFGQYDGQAGRPVGGHLYVPSADKCLSAINTGMGPPFTFELADCEVSDDSSQVTQNFAKAADGTLLFVGETQADGSYIWFGDDCASGTYGVPATPTVGTAPFQCADSSDVVALTLA